VSSNAPFCSARRTHEEVVCIGIGPSNLEQLHQVVELAVNISTNRDRAFLRAGVRACQSGMGLRYYSQPAERLTLLARSLAPGISPLVLGRSIAQVFEQSIMHTFSHSLCTSASDNCLHFMRLSIQPSSVEMDGGSARTAVSCGSGVLPTSSILTSMTEKCEGGCGMRCAQMPASNENGNGK
jgi:hypothetical protein